ncbi:MAG: hypothetical protein AAF585_27955 [Verrucomicrobiota bacterium]
MEAAQYRPSIPRQLFCLPSIYWLWIPFFLILGGFPLSIVAYRTANWLGNGIAILGGVSIIFLFVMMIVWFSRRRKVMGFSSLIILIVSTILAIPFSAAVLIYFSVVVGDDFATGLTLPTGVHLEIPKDSHNHTATIPDDPYQTALLKSLATPGTSDPRITPGIPSLGKLYAGHPDLLMQYLTAHPAWHVHIHRGNKHAMRRWVRNGRWERSLNGYYSAFGSVPHEYQTRTNIGLSGKAWFGRAQQLRTGSLVTPIVTLSGSLQQSAIQFDESEIVVELFEQSDALERRLTKTAIAELEKEFGALLADPTWKSAASLLPPGAITTGQPSFQLYNAMQPGIYNAEIWCNPGEPGQIYLKAFEITKGTQLSKHELRNDASEFVGWSANSNELFAADVHFTISEGDWGQYYGGRFEVWFKPDAKGPDRKLMDSNWKIEGWMH